MTPSAALTAAIARLNAAGLTECVSPNGLTDGGSQRLDKGFAIKPKYLKFIKGRTASTQAGAQVEMGLSIQIGHVLKPGAGQEAPSQALTDIHEALRYLWTPDTPLTSGGGAAIYLGNVATSYQSGGEYLIQGCDIRLVFNLELTAP